jgi:hypothetical protein
MVPLGGTTRSNSTGPPARAGCAFAGRSGAVRFRRLSRPAGVHAVSVAGNHRPIRSRWLAGTGSNLSAGVTGSFSSSAWCGRGVVVVRNPQIDCRLRLGHGREWAGDIEEIGTERAVEPLHLPVLIRGGRGGQPVGDAVLAADLVEQHLAVALAVPAEPISELLPVECRRRSPPAARTAPAPRPAPGRPSARSRAPRLSRSRSTGSDHRPR